MTDRTAGSAEAHGRLFNILRDRGMTPVNAGSPLTRLAPDTTNRFSEEAQRQAFCALAQQSLRQEPQRKRFLFF